MDLALAVFEEGAPTSCRVRYTDSPTEAWLEYGPLVQDRVRIRRGDLVAIDRGGNPPRIVWRWWHGTVEQLAGGRASVSRNHGDPGPVSADVDLIDNLQGLLKVGDTVFCQGHQGGAIAIDVVADGMPAHPEWIRDQCFPDIRATYAPATDS